MDLGAGLDFLVRVDMHARPDDALGSDRDLVSDRRALVYANVRANVAGAADHGALDRSVPPDVGCRIEHRVRDAGPLAQGDARAEHRVGAQTGVLGQARVVADEGRALDRLQVVDFDALPDPDVAAQADARDLQLNLFVEGVEVRLSVLIEVSDVLPVAVENATVDRPAHLEQEREEVGREVERAPGGNVMQNLGVEHVDAGVDGVREDLAPGGLLEEALDPPVVVGDYDPELERVVDRFEANRRRASVLAVVFHQRVQIDVAERVAGDYEEGLIDIAGRHLDRSGRAQRLFFDRVFDRHPERLSVAEIGADRLRHEGERDGHVVDALRVQELEDVLHAGLAHDRHHRLGLVRGERAQARALSPGHDDRLHLDSTTLSARAT